MDPSTLGEDLRSGEQDEQMNDAKGGESANFSQKELTQFAHEHAQLTAGPVARAPLAPSGRS